MFFFFCQRRPSDGLLRVTLCFIQIILNILLKSRFRRVLKRHYNIFFACTRAPLPTRDGNPTTV